MITISNKNSKQDFKQIKKAYDLTAEEYAKQFFKELDNKPFDRALLKMFAERVKDKKKILEIGCGPGEIANYLHKLKVKIKGIDLSDKMVEQARKLNPKIKFEPGDVMKLKYKDNSIGGIVAFYLIVNFSLADINKALIEIYRVLKKGGIFLTSFHTGDEVIHLEEFLGKNVTIDFIFHNQDKVKRMMEKCGLIVDEAIIRYPYENVEYPSKRAYIFAHKK